MPASRAQRAATAKRRNAAIAMRLAGATYDQIADDLGYASRSAAFVDITRALEINLAEQRRTTDLFRQEELQRLDALWARAWMVLERHHVTVSHGRIVCGDDGDPLLDDGPVLAAIDRLLKIQERRSKFLGLDAPTKHEVVSMDVLDREIQRLTAELGPDAAGEDEGAEAAPPGEG
jgi:hypothetical protein